jgi:anti-anti-sigma factor
MPASVFPSGQTAAATSSPRSAGNWASRQLPPCASSSSACPAASHLIIDLSAVEHADASGLAVLVGSRRRARLLGGSLRLAAPSPQVARVLSATGMNRHLDIFPTVRAAITGQPRLPDVIFPPATVPARGRIEGVLAGGAAQPARPAIDRATARAGQGLIS